jgi:hypothetical protein
MNIIFEPSDCRVTLKRVTPSVAVASDIHIEIIILTNVYSYSYSYCIFIFICICIWPHKEITNVPLC